MHTRSTTNTHETLGSMSDEEVLLLNELALRMGYLDEGVVCLPDIMKSIESEILERSLGQSRRSDIIQVKAA